MKNKVKKILCRADGNPEMGLGHLYRMLAIAAFYREHYEIAFVTRERFPRRVIPEAYPVTTIPRNIPIGNEPEWLGTHFPPEEHVCIADGYQFDGAYQKKIKAQGYTLLYIDDLISEHIYADVVINHSPHASKDQYRAETYTQFALGTPYALLRSVFNKAAEETRTLGAVAQAFICFGGADPQDLSCKAAKGLLKVEGLQGVHVVLGGAYVHAAIGEMARKEPKLHIYRNLGEEALCGLMKHCQVAVASASTVSYELCSVKMPILGGYYVENQRNIYEALTDLGAIAAGGDFSKYTEQDFYCSVSALLDKGDYRTYITRQQCLFDGKNKRRFLALLSAMHLSFRKAIQTDSAQVFEWSNDPLVRQNSFQADAIPWEEHRKWFAKKINYPQTLFLIAQVNSVSAGVVRYEVDKGHAVVGILIGESFRGQKLASEFLKKSAELYFAEFEEPILAYIKKSNRASVKSFEKGGYQLVKEESVNGILSFVYKLERKDVTG